jgi:hypothetical protein
MATRPVEYLRLYEMEPERSAGQEHLYARGQHFVLVYSRVDAGVTLESDTGEYEHFVLLQDGGEIEVTSSAGSAVVATRAAVIVPPGRSTVAVHKPSVLVRVFAPPTPELLSKCVNQAYYAEANTDVAPFSLWPEPVDGYKLRVYDFDNVPGADFIRSRNIAVQWAPYREAQNGVFGGMPHSHETFEHTLLCMSGGYILHMRYPWGKERADWREDEHVPIGTPSLVVVPPRVTHLPEAAGARNSMLDISAPPRADLMTGLPNFAESVRLYPFPASG